MFEKLSDAKNTFEGKALAVFMAVVMAFSLSNLSSFANATEGDASSDAPAAQDADTSSGASDSGTAEPAQTGEPETTAPVETPAAPEAPAQSGAPVVQSPAPSTDLPVAEPGVAVVGLDFEHAYVKYLDQDLKAPLASFNAPLNKELAFTAHADTGFEIDKVKAVVDGAETELAADGQTGEYKVPANQVTSNLVVKVEAKAAETGSPAPEDSSATPITSDTKIEAGEDAAGNDADSAVEDEDAVEVEADVSNPAFEGYATAGNVLVKVTAAEGVLPEGATVQAAPVERRDVVDAVAEKIENQGKTLESAVAIDVTLLDKDGNEIQPDGAVNVCFFDANVEGEEVGVYRVSDDASRVETIGARQADAAVQSFDVDHFTIYVVAGDDEPYRAPVGGKLVIVNFVYPSGATAEKSFGEGVMPDESGVYQAFSHEFEVPMGYSASLSQDSENAGFQLAVSGSSIAVSITPTKESEETLSATVVFTPAKVEYTVEHKYPKLDGVEDELKTSEGQTLETKDGFYVISEKATGDFGSATDPVSCPQDGFSLSEVRNSTIDAESEIVAEVVYERNVHSVQFDTKGGSYVKAATVPHKSAFALPTGASAPTREGYDFDGWFDTEACEGEALTSLPNVSEDTTLYAKWAPANVLYRVILWAENADDDNYSNVGSVEAEALAGESTESLANEEDLRASFSQRIGKDSFGRSEADYYHFKEIKSTDHQVAADGSTVVNAYFDRNEYTLEFVYGFEDENGRYVWTSTGAWSNSNGTSYKGDSFSKVTDPNRKLPETVVITAKYGADISQAWPTQSYNYASQNFISWATVKDSGYYKRNADNKNIKGTYSTMSDELILDPLNSDRHHVMHAYWNSGTKYTYRYYVVSLKEKGDRQYNGVEYDWIKDESILSTANGSGQNALSFPHLTAPIKVYGVNAGADKKGGNILFFYDREDYTVTYYNGNEESKKLAPYQTILSEDEYGLAPDACPYKKGTKDWKFEGWYLDDAGTTPMKWGDELSSDTTVYAKWKAPEYDVSVDLNYEGAPNPATQKVAEGGVAVLDKPADRAGYVFGGWYTDPGCTVEFDAKAPFIADQTVYAKWDKVRNAGYSVKYVDENGSDVAEGIDGATGLVGSTVTANAVSVDGYVADKGSASIVLDVDADKNVIVFVYSKVTDYQYRVEYAYRDKAGNSYLLHDDETWIDTKLGTVNVVPDEQVVASLPGYTLQDQYKTVKLYADRESNVVTFYLDANEYDIAYEGVDEVTGWGAEGIATNPNPSSYTTRDTVNVVNPVRPGYTFTGWTIASKSGNELAVEGNEGTEGLANVVISKGSRGHLLLTASWEANEDTAYVVQHYKVAADHATASLYEQQGLTGTTDEPVSAESLTIAGYTYQPAFNENGMATVASGTVAGDGSLVLKLYYTPNADQLVYDPNGGIGSMDATRGVTDEEVAVADNGFSYPGYLFTGWNTQANGEGQHFAPGDFYTLTLDDDVLFAQWTEKSKVGITYQAETGGTVSLSSEMLSPATGKAAGSTASPEPGYHFVKWTASVEGGSAVDVSTDQTLTPQIVDSIAKATGVYRATVFTAQFEENTALITYRATAGGSVTRPDETLRVVSGSAEGSTAQPAPATDTDLGYYFVGWSVGDSSDIVSTEPELDGATVAQFAKEGGLFVPTTFTAHFAAKEKLVLTAGSDTFVYDGTERVVDAFALEGGEGLSVKNVYARAAETNAGTFPVAFYDQDKIAITDNAGVDVTDRYAVEYVKGTLTIEQRPVTLFGYGWEQPQQFTGSAYESNDYKVEQPSGSDDLHPNGTSGLVSGQKVEASYSITGADVGSYTGSFAEGIAIRTNAGEDATGNYKIVKVPGNLEIVPTEKAVVVTAASQEWKYDGENHADGSYRVTFGGVNVEPNDAGKYILPTGDEVTATVSGSVKNVSDTHAGNNEVTAFSVTNSKRYQTVEKQDGTLTINKRSVTLTSDSASKPYDGTPLVSETVDVTGDGWVAGEGAVYTFTGSQTVFGSSENLFDYTLAYGAIEGNYRIEKYYGMLKVTNAAARFVASVAANSGKATYDGAEHTVTGLVDETDRGVPVKANGLDFYVSGLTAQAAGTDAGTYTANVVGTPVVKDAAGNDVTNQFDVKATPGTLTVEKRNVTLRSATDEKPYDGTPLTNGNVSVEADGWAAGEGAVYHVTGSQTTVGFSPNAFTYALTNGTKADNYNVETVQGTLTVTSPAAQFEVTVEANSAEYTYDGQKKEVSGFTNETDEGIAVTVGGVAYRVTGLSASAERTDAGSAVSYVMGTPTVLDAQNNNVTELFHVKPVNGTLTVKQRTVTLTSASATREYTGEALVAHGVTVSGDGWAAGEGAVYAYSGSQTLVGSSPNYFTATPDQNTKAGNYRMKLIEGALTVKNRDAAWNVTVKAASDTVLYDGAEHAVTGFENETDAGVPVEIGANTYYVTGLSARAAGTDADTYATHVTGEPVVKDAAGNDVTSEFSVAVEPGKLVVNKRGVVLQSASATKPYDGTPLESRNVSVSGDGWAVGEGADYAFTGSRLYVGTSDNTFDYVLNGGAAAGNYTIEKRYGSLTVTNRDALYEVTVAANSTTVVYDGVEQRVSGLQNETDRGVAVQVDGRTYYVSGLAAEAAGTVAGTYPATVTGTPTVLDAQGNDVSTQFAVDTQSGSLVVEQRPLTLASASLSKKYDGRPLTNGAEPLAVEDGWAAGEGASYVFTGSVVLPGETAPNAFAVKANAGTNLSNYVVSKSEGQLSVENRDARYEATVTAQSGTFAYDGAAHTVAGFVGQTDRGIPVQVDGQTYYVSGLTSQAEGTNVVESVASIPVKGVAAVKDADGNVVSDQFNVRVVPGSLTIQPAALVIKADDAGKRYGDGDPALTATVSGLVPGDVFEGSYEVTRAAGENAGPYEITVGNVQLGERSNYTATTQPGRFVIAPIDSLTVVVGDASKPYDGTPLVPSEMTPIGLVPGDVIEVVYGGSQTGVGTSAGTATDYVVRNAAGEDVTANYPNIEVVPGSLTVTPAEVVIAVDDAQKTAGANDPTFTGTITGLVNDADLGTVTFERTNAAEAVGVYEDVLTAVYIANPNYTVTVVPGTFTIVAPAPVAPPAPATPPAPTPTPATPGTPPADNPLTPVVTPVVNALQNAVETVIGPNETPLAGPEQTIEDDGTPLAGYDRVNCWVHYYLILGIVVTVVYGAGVLVRRINFTRRLKGYEDDVLGVEDEPAAAPAAPAPFVTGVKGA